MSSFEEFIGSLGPVTKFMTAASVLSTIAFVSNMVDPSYIILNISDTVFKLQLWRVITASTFLGKFGFPWLLNLAMFVMYLKNHEDFHIGRRAELVWMLAFVILVLHVIGFFMNLSVVSFSLIMALVWIYCRRNEGQSYKIYSFAFSASVFPWALTAFHLVLGQDVTNDLIGIVAGHVFFFFHDMHPLTNGGRNYIECPAFMYRIPGLERQKISAQGVHRGPEARPAGNAQPAAHRWAGTGHRLGTN